MGWVGGSGGRGQGGCERRIEVFVKLKKNGGVVGGGLDWGSGWGGQGGCERRIEVFGKIHKKIRAGGSGEGGGVRWRGGGRVGWWGGSGWM